jgi:hypothetical protein
MERIWLFEFDACPKETTMQISAEIRWFWPIRCPEPIETWFRGGATEPGGGSLREDQYLYEPKQTEFGLKRRGEKAGVEAKGLVAASSQPSDIFPFVGPIEIWCKWKLLALTLRDVSIIHTSKNKVAEKV